MLISMPSVQQQAVALDWKQTLLTASPAWIKSHADLHANSVISGAYNVSWYLVFIPVNHPEQ